MRGLRASGDRCAAATDAIERRSGLGRVRRHRSGAHHRERSGRRRGGRRGARSASERARIITFDMGGTTAKAGLIEHGEVIRTEAIEVGGGVMAGSRLLVGAGYMLKLPAIDLAEVGAGGGSICRLDEGGAPKVGPRSAGADPGPVCYGRGGVAPTITDCNLVLGYLDPGGLVGGALKLDRDAAAAAIARDLAGPLGCRWRKRRIGMLRLASATMMRAIRAVSVERGRDPRQVRAAGVRRQWSVVRGRDRPGTGDRTGCRAAVAGGVQRVWLAGRGHRASRQPKFAGPPRCRWIRRGINAVLHGTGGSRRGATGPRRVLARPAVIHAVRTGALPRAVERNRRAAAGWAGNAGADRRHCSANSTSGSMASARRRRKRWN